MHSTVVSNRAGHPSGTERALQAEDKEHEFVHQVYEEIAAHFSHTRYKVGILGCRSLSDSPVALATGREIFVGLRAALPCCRRWLRKRKVLEG